MVADPREEKLPAWASATIDRLRSQVTAAQKARDEARLSNGPATSDTLIDPYNPAGPIFLPHGERIRFRLGSTDGPEPEVDRFWLDGQVVRQRHQDGTTSRYLEIMAGDTISVTPQSSNVIRIRVTDHF